MADVASIKVYIGLEPDNEKYDAFIAECLVVAVALVDDFVGVGIVPEEVLDLAYTIVTADLYSRRDAPNGVINSQIIGADGVTQTPMRIARDPLAGAYGILRRWVLTW